ncbi:DNA topoisomerase IV [Spongiivirga citrea]|uniref:DNA topoisomerase IV n=1 Tax=Spongiivirga citrea TaxID=1481457 RepID=A0A6M0CFW8_9FLAO|nr:DNA topoisomerase IV [Spongiivirga citrea]NER16721.1 DNA topoisomerase IV [Spongiivirga citrea]
MKQLLLATLVIVLNSCYSAPERKCADFKVGTFEFETEIDGKIAKTKFVRNDSIEIDYYQNKIDTASIQWINDCEYIVKKINPKSIAEQKAVHIKILTTKKNSYTFEYSLVGKTNKQKGEAFKIN